MHKELSTFLLSISLLPLSAMAAYQCGHQAVPSSVRNCPDGSIPMFIADEVQPHVPPQPADGPSRRAKPNDRPEQSASNLSDPSYYFGVWHTNVPGAVWTTPSEVQGYDRLRARPGALAGDLVINPNGTYTWNSYGGKSGRWVHGDAESPIVLIDTAENRRWGVLPDKTTRGREIYLYDGSSFSYRGRR
jgi:hypothetical protein